MHSPYRKYITGPELEAFNIGFAETLGYPTPAQVIRLSLRTITRRTVLAGLVGIRNKPGGRTFELPIPRPGELTLQRYTELGAEMGRGVEGWLRPSIQEPLQALAAAQGRNVWNVHELEELSQDAIDAWEEAWRNHLNGRLHAKAKEDLVRRFAKEMMAAVDALAEKVKAEKAAAAAKAKPAVMNKEADKVGISDLRTVLVETLRPVGQVNKVKLGYAKGQNGQDQVITFDLVRDGKALPQRITLAPSAPLMSGLKSAAEILVANFESQLSGEPSK